MLCYVFIGSILINEGLLEDGKRVGPPSTHTVQAYVAALMESYFFYDIKRFDIKGKEFLRTMDSEAARERELTPLTKINDNYEKIVLSLNPGMDASYDGIKSINLVDWLVEV